MSTLVLDMTQARFEQAPRLASEQIYKVDDVDRRKKNDLYYTLEK